MKTYDYEVVVAGGGPTGVAAAIAAARNGAKVLIVEQYGCLGGMSTVGQVAPWMTFHAKDGTQTIMGIGQEIVDRLVACNASRGHVLDTMGETSTITPFNPEVLKLILAEMAIEAKVDLLFHTFIFDVEKDNDTITALFAANKDGKIKITGKFFIDGTGDADIAAFSGCQFEKGDNNDGLVQPVSMNFTMSNVDFEKVRQYMLSNPDEFHFKTKFEELEKDLPNSVSGFFSFWNKSQENMSDKIHRDRFLFFRGFRDDVATVNTTRILGIDSTNTDDLTKAEVLGRKQALEVSEMLVKFVPGFENAYVTSIASSIGIRESRRIIGKYVLTFKDLQQGTRFEDDVMVSSYTIDRHDPAGNGFTQFEIGSYGIPLRALMPIDFKNLLVGGRSISTDVLAQSATRTTPSCFGMGQGAGIACALALKNNLKSFSDLDLKTFKETLLNDGVYL